MSRRWQGSGLDCLVDAKREIVRYPEQHLTVFPVIPIRWSGQPGRTDVTAFVDEGFDLLL